MAIADVSIRPNSIRFRDAVRAVHERVSETAGDFGPPPGDREFEALRELYEGSENRHADRPLLLQDLTRTHVVSALLNGSLKAHFSDATEARDIPGWAWIDAGGRWDLWIGGCLFLPALLPDEWQRWPAMRLSWIAENSTAG